MVRRLNLTHWKAWALAATVAAAAIVGGLPPAGELVAGDPPGGEKLDRSLRRLSRIMDEMLIDSPNWLVPGRDNTRAMYLPGHGAIFTFEATLVNRGRSWNFSVGDRWVFWDDDDDDWRDRDRRRRDRDDDAKSSDSDADDSRSWRDRTRDREQRLYERGQREIIEVLMDYGDTLTDLKGGEWVTVMVYLDDADYFYDKDVYNLVMKVKIDDLRAHGSGSLSEDALAQKFVVEEY